MHQTQTFVHLIILLLPRARLTPLRTPAFEINGHHNPLEDSNRLFGKLQARGTVLKAVPSAQPDLPEI
jgi:hypothetical protein